MKYSHIISILATAVVTLIASSLMHVRDEVSQQEVTQVIDAKVQAATAPIAQKMDIMIQKVEEEDSTNRVISEQLKHFRVKTTWYSVQ